MMLIRGIIQMGVGLILLMLTGSVQANAPCRAAIFKDENLHDKVAIELEVMLPEPVVEIRLNEHDIIRLSVYSRENTVWIQEMEPSGHRLPHFDLETPQHGLTGDFRLPIFGPTTTQLYITFQDEVRTDGMTVRYYSKHSGSSHQKADSCEIVAPPIANI